MAVNMHIDAETKLRNHFEETCHLLLNGLGLLGGDKQKPSFSEVKIGLGLFGDSACQPENMVCNLRYLQKPKNN